MGSEAFIFRGHLALSWPFYQPVRACQLLFSLALPPSILEADPLCVSALRSIILARFDSPSSFRLDQGGLQKYRPAVLWGALYGDPMSGQAFFCEVGELLRNGLILAVLQRRDGIIRG